MHWGNKDGVRFVPVREVQSEDDYTIVDNLEQLEWYAKSLHKPSHKSNRVLSAVKKSTETKIETQTVYFTDLKSGRCGFIQLLYSSVIGGIYKGFQLNFKSFRSEESEENEEKESRADVWESFKLEDIKEFSELTVNSSRATFAFKHSLDSSAISKLEIKVDIPVGSNTNGLKIDLVVDLYRGILVNPDGCSYYLDKPLTKDEISKQRDAIFSKKMVRHLFVPRAQCCGNISYLDSKGEKVDLQLDKVPGLYIDAVQGLVPYKAANRWNFLCFQSLTTSLLCMEFTTTEEYNRTTVTIWCSTRNNQIETVGSSINGKNIQFEATTKDDKTGYEYPTQIAFPMGFVEQHLRLVNRYDIMGELPSLVKSLAENIAHIKPYIYQYCQSSTHAGQKGISIIESTFISS
ncbi:hypothetical protein ZYGR_0A04220 [Zygosaccharomyces rouxii]|uniref:ZYRO0A09570p n=2 Tax=Zygosaccharomyces rouxii TaxID=4956 RepID=C5DQ89_ZYGRC|nr:uncharacterized protein ZYRO0A09570g [Zygosaccharomyces rouxii]KAH9198631.1 oxidative stress survival, Svf1-like protein [Zygosaccharomyces rouxii]GAV46825.1 hypothetical protein ZYGR_0A04220 [Zygosaccharomyces rouxii]CAR25850.1 ZYRO0A09570p [Zygosaccharomyces rouxii]